MRVAVLINDGVAPPGYLGDALDRAGAEWQVVRLDRGEPLPGLDEVDAVVALGGTMGCYDDDEYPYLVEEKRFLAAGVAAGVPVLGICLGAQLLAEALGGRAYKALRPEAVFAPVELTEEGHSDPVAGTLLGRAVVRFHEDTWELPAGAVPLATGGGFEQAFRLGSGLGIQSHPEAGAELVAEWLSQDGARRLAEEAGVDPSALEAAIRQDSAAVEATAQRFFDAWLEEAANPGF